MSQPSDNDLVVSHLTLRKMVGVVSLLLPFVLGLGHFAHSNIYMQPTISHFYFTPFLGDVMVGALCAVGSFLICYKGYEATDRRLTTLAGFSVIGVALITTTTAEGNYARGYTRTIVDVCAPVAEFGTSCAQNFYGLTSWFPFVHFSLAVVFFACLGWISYFEFTKTNPNVPMTPRKQMRNRIYRGTGLVILAVLVLIGAQTNFGESWDWWDDYAMTFLLEGIGIVAFAIAWLVKGEAVLADR